jgi:hypothetical protein
MTIFKKVMKTLILLRFSHSRIPDALLCTGLGARARLRIRHNCSAGRSLRRQCTLADWLGQVWVILFNAASTLFGWGQRLF